MLFDTHCHLQDARLDAGLAGVFERARAAGVRALCCCGTAPRDWPAVGGLADRHPDLVIPAFGVHPWYLDGLPEDWEEQLCRHLARPGAAVGEIGLDHAIDSPLRELQDRLFRRQLELAAARGRPVSVHCRRAWASLLAHLEAVPVLPPALVVHAYSGPAELIAPLARFGVHFSFAGGVTFSGRRRVHAAAAAVPADRLLIETDAPDLAPYVRDGAGGGRIPAVNEPANLPVIRDALAAVRGVPARDIEAVTWENACRVFGLPRPDPDRTQGNPADAT